MSILSVFKKTKPVVFTEEELEACSMVFRAMGRIGVSVADANRSMSLLSQTTIPRTTKNIQSIKRMFNGLSYVGRGRKMRHSSRLSGGCSP